MVAARVNWGRWIVDCPACNGAERITRGVNALRCTLCDQAIQVEWPSEYESINATLSRRPKLENRNWWPGESVADLERENVAYGVDRT